MKNMKVKRVLVDLYRLFVSREAGEKEKEGSRGTMGRGREKIPLPIVSRALSMDTQREPLRWKESYYAFHLGPSSSIFVLEFSYHLHESEQVLVCPSTATLKTNHPCFLFFLFSLISMLCYYPRSFKHTTSAQQFKSFLHAHYWPVCTRPPPLRKNRGRDILFLRGGGVRIRLAHCKTRLSFYIGQLSYTCSTFLLRTPFTSFIYIFFRQILIIDIVG